MSSPLAIAAVTAALKDLLNDGLLNHDLSQIGSFSVTSTPPDRITTGETEPNQLNLFLYQVTANPGWRNVQLPSRDGDGSPLRSTPLALDLHYLLSAYGAQDLNAEILLGYAMQLLHETPMLSRAQLRTVLGGVSPVDGSILPGPFGTLSALDLADQVELVKITPVFLTAEELSKMWTAMQARYRPTMAYMVSVVLIEARGASRVAPPVLQRGRDDRGIISSATPPPNLTSARTAASDVLPAVRLGDDVLIKGSQLEAAAGSEVIFDNVVLKVLRSLPAGHDSLGNLTVHLPSVAEDANALSEWAVGFYAISLRLAAPDFPAWKTSGIPIALAPLITVSPLAHAAGDIDLTVTCTPRLRPEQETQTSLIFGLREIFPNAINTPADKTKPTTLTFHVPAAPAGDHLVRLRVQGLDSLPITLAGPGAKMKFDPQQTVQVT
jgi:Pvc16 N-terminal domain